MDITDIIARGDGGRNLAFLAQQLGLDEAQTRAAVDQLVPAVEAGIRRETTSPDGLSGLLAALAKGNHARYLDGDDAGIVDDGNAILGHIFGSKDVSRGVAAHAAAETGIGDGILKQMLPMIAAMVMGGLSKKVGGRYVGRLRRHWRHPRPGARRWPGLSRRRPVGRRDRRAWRHPRPGPRRSRWRGSDARRRRRRTG